jgi:hypothetical protein
VDEAITTAIASALATKVTDAAASAGRSAWDALVRLVRAKLGSASDTAAVLERACGPGEEPAAIAALAESLARASIKDPYFAAQLQALWGKARVELKAGDGGTVNQISGTVFGNVIQARDVTVRGSPWDIL